MTTKVETTVLVIEDCQLAKAAELDKKAEDNPELFKKLLEENEDT